MALGTRFDFDIHRGDSRLITFQVVDEFDVPVNITGTTATWIISELDTDAPNHVPAPVPGSTFVTKTVGTGITITAPTTGNGQIALASADTTGAYAPVNYYHEMQMVLGGETTTVMFGILGLKRDIIAPGP
jgi:hypothetical protein